MAWKTSIEHRRRVLAHLREQMERAKKASTTYDQRCFDLAETCLEWYPHLANDRRTDELVKLIQLCIDDYIAAEQNNYEPPDPPGWEGGFAENH